MSCLSREVSQENMWSVEILLVLSFLSVETLERRCEWGARLCETGNPLNSTWVCNFGDPLTSLTGGMEIQELSHSVQAVMSTLDYEPVDTQQSSNSYLNFLYYLRIDLLCGSEKIYNKDTQMALMTGLTPEVTLIIQEPTHPVHLKPQRLHLVLTTAPSQDNVSCDSNFCQFGWYAPMPMLNGSVVYRVKVNSNGVGQGVPEKSFSMNVNGFVQSNKTQKAEMSVGVEIPALEDMLSLETASRPLWAVYEHAPVLLLAGIPGFNAVLMTATEFQHTSLIEVGIASWAACSLSCPQQGKSSLMIQEAIATESSLFIRHNHLLYRFVGNYSLLALRVPPSGSWQPVLQSVCVSGMVPVFLPHHGTEYLYVLGGGGQKDTLYRFEIYDGDLNYTELLDSKGRTACQFMNSTGCEVRWAAFNPVHSLTDIILVELEQREPESSYQLLILEQDFRLGDAFPRYIPKGNGHSFITVTDMQKYTDVELVLRGMVFSPMSGTLYIWGGTLICSLDVGQTFLFFAGFPLDQMIKYFTMSFHGEFAFVTETEELWWGQEGVGSVVRLRPSPGWQVFSTLQTLRGHLSHSTANSLLTVYYDWDKQLQEVIYTMDTEGRGSVLKRKIPVPEILSRSHHSTHPHKVRQQELFSDVSFHTACPFILERLENLPHPEPFNRIQQYQATPPRMHPSSGLHSTQSLITYQGLMYRLLHMHSAYLQVVGDPGSDPIQRMWKDKSSFQDWYFYIGSNAFSSSGFSVEMEGYSRPSLSSELTLPDKVYLNYRDSLSFTIHITATGHQQLLQDSTGLSHIWLSVEVSDRTFLDVMVYREEQLHLRTVTFNVTVMDRGVYPGQALAGEGLVPLSVLLRICSSEMQCYQQTDQGIVLKGQHRLSVLIGCRPGSRLAYDAIGSVQESIRLNGQYLDCLNPDPSSPCFYFEDYYRPIILLQDMVSGRSERYLGSYTFKIVGGGPYSRENIRSFTPEEVVKFNSFNYSSQRTLIWIFEEVPETLTFTEQGFPVMTFNTSPISWFCQSNSPCGELVPHGLISPDFYFTAEVSSKGLDMNTYCDFTLQFELHVHGFSLRTKGQLLVMLITLISIMLFLTCYILYHCYWSPSDPSLKKTVGQASITVIHHHAPAASLTSTPLTGQ